MTKKLVGEIALKDAPKRKEKNKLYSQNIESQSINIEPSIDKDTDEEKSKRRKKEIAEKGLKSYIRVGDKYRKEVFEPTKKGELKKQWVERQRATIKEDFGNYFYMIPKYDGFVNIPSHTNYQQVIGSFFNEYHKLSHQPNEGNFDTILHVLRHIFDEKIDFALDYLQLLYLHPYQRLPIILLESEEKGTGKSTFGILVDLIFEENAIKLGNGDLESDFNAYWVKKLALIVDETSLEKKSIMQMLKRLSTETGQVTSNAKNVGQVQADFFGKFIFMSNEEGKALPIERGDTRFAVFKVPTFKEKEYEDNPNIEVEIKVQIPAFLHHLKNRQLVNKENKSRMWFSPDVYQTKQLLTYFEGNVSYVAKAIRSLVKDTFNVYPEESELNFSASNIMSELDKCKYIKSVDRQQVKKALEQDLKLKEEEKGRYTFFSLSMVEIRPTHYPDKGIDNNRYYTFKKEDFVQKLGKVQMNEHNVESVKSSESTIPLFPINDKKVDF